MSYLVLARKYRPQVFQDVVAQEHVTTTLQNAVRNNRIGSGYLFCGPRGTGKTTVARLLAKAVNCKNGPTPTPCGKCPACAEITSGSSLDVLEIDAASNTGVDDVRTLRENIRYLPTSGKRRIYIIDEVHRLSPSAFDALLKVLEEPPAHAMFIFATTEPHRVPETILSRTQRFDFKRVSVPDLKGNLKRIASSEGFEIDDGALSLLARKADGSVRDSLSLLDQVAAYGGDSIGEQDVVQALGLIDRQFLHKFTEAIAARDAKQSLALTTEVLAGGVDIADFVDELLEHFRILLILATDKDAGASLHFNDDELSEYSRQADFYSVGDIIRLMKMATDMSRDLKAGVDERLVLQVATIKMALLEATVSFEDILKRLNESTPTAAPGSDLFNGQKKKGDSLTLKRNQPESPTVAPPTDITASKPMNLPIVQAGWSAFLAQLRSKRPMLASQLGMAVLKEVTDTAIVATFAAGGTASRQLVEKSTNLKLIEQTLQEHYRTNLSMRFETDPDLKAPGDGTGKTGKPKVDAKKIERDSPHIQKLLEQFDGEIVGVRKAT